MKAAFLIPGLSLDLAFESSTLDPLRESMLAQDIKLYGVTENWRGHSLPSFGELAVEQAQLCQYDGMLIAHSLGALAALRVIDKIKPRYLVLCSPSALFSEDIKANNNPELYQRIGERLMTELKNFSAMDAVSEVNDRGVSTTILYGEKERDLYPDLVVRCQNLATDITDAELIEVRGAAHFIGEEPYSSELAQVVSDIFTDL